MPPVCLFRRFSPFTIQLLNFTSHLGKYFLGIAKNADIFGKKSAENIFWKCQVLRKTEGLFAVALLDVLDVSCMLEGGARGIRLIPGEEPFQLINGIVVHGILIASDSLQGLPPRIASGSFHMGDVPMEKDDHRDDD